MSALREHIKDLWMRLDLKTAGAVMFLVTCGPYVMPGLLGLSRRLLSSITGPATAPYKAGTHSVVFITVPNMTVGKDIAKQLLEYRLAACVNLIPGLVSMYEWNGKLEEDNEVLMKIKTRSQQVDRISDLIRDIHPYDVAEVISLPIENGNSLYLDWLDDMVPEE